MSEKSDLRERAREWINNPQRILDDAEFGQAEEYELIFNLLQALDDAEREEKERCARIADVFADTHGADGYTGEEIAAAIRREGGRDNG